jgi:DNA invertase Pin-like site-specific DNA recombinase
MSDGSGPVDRLIEATYYSGVATPSADALHPVDDEGASPYHRLVGERVLSSDDRECEETPVLGYATVSTQRGEHPNRDLQKQAETIASECERRGLALLELVREREPHRGHALDRPGLGYALQRISAGEAKGLVVAELARLTHSVPELGRVLEWISCSDVRLVAASPCLDTDEESGRLAVATIIAVSRWEHDWLVERTRTGMRAARRTGPRGVADQPELRERIARMRAAGMTLQAISDRLNADGVPTVRGGLKWRPSSVQTAAGYRRRPPGRRPSSLLDVGRDADGRNGGNLGSTHGSAPVHDSALLPT